VTVVRAILVVGVGLLGLVLVVGAHPRFRRATLHRRLTPYLGALGPRRSRLLASSDGATGLRAAAQPLVDALAHRLQRALGDDGHDLPDRLAAAGSSLTPTAFRGEQVSWGLAGVTAGLAAALALAATGRGVSLVMAMLMAAASAAIGVVARDRSLTRSVERRRERAQSELPTLVDMVCIAVTAGESLRAALELVAASGDGPISMELRSALNAARSGATLIEALEVRARRLGLPAFGRFVASVAAAQERGIPLADTLRAMSFDVREAGKRDVIEAAGKKQVSMLAPVIGLILPVAIVFAFYPGVVAIRTLTR
jgi:tight adherence protein C